MCYGINRDEKINAVKKINADTNSMKQKFKYLTKLQLFHD